MRIGIDARLLSSDTPTGIGMCIIETLKQFCKYDAENEYYLFSNKPISQKYRYRDNFHLIVLPSKSGSIWIYTHLSRRLASYNIDVFWGPAHLLPIGQRHMRKVLTINDIALIINPQWGNWRNAIIQNTLVRLSIKCADSIVAISNHTKHDLIEIMRIPEEKIRVAYPGIVIDDTSVHCEIQDSVIREDIKSILNTKYILYIGTLEPRKNIVNIIKAFNRLKTEHPKYNLVLVGKIGWKAENILQEISRSPWRDAIINLGYVTKHEKTLLLKNAEFFVFPSYYEGFGIPVAEAIAVGLPVITSRNSSLVEVAGSEQFFVEHASDDYMIYQQMLAVINTPSEELKRKNAVSNKHIRQFTWEAYAQGIYTAMMGEPLLQLKKT